MKVVKMLLYLKNTKYTNKTYKHKKIKMHKLQIAR